jgi:hypothetical protein
VDFWRVFGKGRVIFQVVGVLDLGEFSGAIGRPAVPTELRPPRELMQKSSVYICGAP